MKLTKFAGLAASASLLFAAMPALAATPQEIINASLKNISSEGAMRIVGEVNVQVREKFYRAADKQGPEAVDVTMRFDQRALALQNGTQDSEGRFTLAKFEMVSDSQKITLPQPVTLDWKYLNPALYAYVSNVPQALIDTLKGELDLTPYVNQWYKLEMPAGATQAVTGQQQISEINGLAKNLADKQVLRVTRTEKTWTNANGDKLARVRIAANRAALNADRLASLREAYKIKNYTERRSAIAAINKEYSDTLKELAKIQAVAEVNTTKNTVDRVEISFAQTDPKKSCTWNDATNKSVCRTIGTTSVKILGGVSFLPTTNAPVLVPSEAKTFEPLQNIFQATE